MWEQDVERTLSQHQQDIISDAVVNQKVGRPYDLQLAPIVTQITINLDIINLILSRKLHKTSSINIPLYTPECKLPSIIISQ